MFLQIKTYLTAILVSFLLITGGYAYYAYTEIQHLSLEVTTYKIASEDNLKAKEQSDASCLITVESLTEHYRTQAALTSSQKATGDAINALPTLTLRESSNAAPTKPQGFSDDDRLSPSTMQLLDNAYCDGDKDHCASPTK
jgi:hypothetical protein